MTRAIKTARNRAASMGAAILALGAGAALLGASCELNSRCRGPGCPEPSTGTCPWHCSETVWDGTSASVEGFNNAAVFAVWVGRPREAPTCESSNYFPVRDYYQEPKSIDRCPRCVAEPKVAPLHNRVMLLKDGHCSDDTTSDAHVVSEFVIPAGWDGSCVSQKTDRVPVEEYADFALGISKPESWRCVVSLSLEDVDALWGKMVRTCRRAWPLDQDCEDIAAQCIPEMAPGFRECLEYQGDEPLQECPRSHPELVQAYIDLDGCTWCETAVEGDGWKNKRTLTFYADEQCTQPVPGTDSWADGSCIDLRPGPFPRSVSATGTVESIAECVPRGGEQVGELSPAGLVSYCCRPPAQP